MKENRRSVNKKIEVHAVIMAGGSGTRFWPRSTTEMPKQFLNLVGERTMIQNTVDRLEGIIPKSNIWVVTNEQYVETVRTQLHGMVPGQIIAEPVARNTAPCVASAAAMIHRKDPDAVMVVLPADHLISDRGTFQEILETAIETALQRETLVTIGIRPDRPETGYGYIKMKESGQEIFSGNSVWKVDRFTEKPDEETARSFVNAGNYLWNSGMFIWRAGVIVDAFKHYLPEIYQEMKALLESDSAEEELRRFYHACPSVSIDYGIMEKAASVHVVPGEFGWSDVGSWKAVYDISKKDRDQNVIEASDSILHDSNGNLIYSESGKLISLIGIEHVAVVETGNAILICKLDRSQSVKEVVEELQQDDKKSKFL